MPPPDALRDRILSLTAAHPSPTRAQSRRRSIGLHAVAIAFALAIFQASGGVAHSRGRPLGLTLAIAAGALALAAFATTFIGGGARASTGRPRQALIALSILVPIVTLGWLVAWNGRYAEPFARVGYRCLALTLGLGASFLGAAIVARRRTVVVTPSSTGAALGAAAGAWAGVAVDLWCPLTNAAHAAIGHVVPMILLVASGAVLGHVALRIRSV